METKSLVPGLCRVGGLCRGILGGLFWGLRGGVLEGFFIQFGRFLGEFVGGFSLDSFSLDSFFLVALFFY